MKKYLYVSALFLLSLGFFAVEASSINSTGFIPGQIWYSKSPLTSGEEVKIHTAIWNGDVKEISARVEFYDKNVVLGARDVVVSPSSVKDISISWQVTAGDHNISAKIVSSTINTGNTKEAIVPSLSTTIVDHQFVPVVIREVDGTPSSSADIVKREVNKATTDIKNIVPESISKPISSTFGSIDNFRDKTYVAVHESKLETKKTIDSLNHPTLDKLKEDTSNRKLLDATEKPIAYVRLFLLSAVSFILGSKVAFYGLGVVIIILIARFIYRKTRR
ncbi:MAG: hypothetical protein AAB477_01315 [Patescibacteria group bacterium]